MNEYLFKSEPISAVESFNGGYNNRRQGSNWQDRKAKDWKPNQNQQAQGQPCKACNKEYPHKGVCPARGRRCMACKE